MKKKEKEEKILKKKMEKQNGKILKKTRANPKSKQAKGKCNADHEGSPVDSKGEVDNKESGNSENEDDSAICPRCGAMYPNEGGVWVMTAMNGLILNVGRCSR